MNLIDKNLYRDDEIEVHLGDLLASILLRWKFILICLLICAVLGCGFAFLRTSTDNSDKSLQEARVLLTDEQITNVDNLFERSLAYQEYRASLQADFAQYVYNASQSDQYILLNASYYLSTSLEHLEDILPQTLLTADDYKALEQIVSNGGISSVNDRVSITVPIASDLAVSIPGSTTSTDFFVLVTLYGESEQQCQELLSVVDSALQNYVRSLHDMDPDVTIQAVRQDYSPLSQTFIQDQINQNMSRVNSIENQITNLNNQVSRLSSDEKSYYDLLVEADLKFKTDGDETSHAWIKWAVIGAFLGAVLGAGIVFLQYLFDGKEKIPDEAEQLFQTSMLQRVCFPVKKNLFGNWAARLSGTNNISAEVKAKLLSTDLHLLLEKEGLQKLYLLCDPADLTAARFAEMLKTQARENESLEFAIGEPLSTVEELEAFAQAQCVVVCSELKHTRRTVLAQWRELCVRYQKPIAGIVAVENCW